MNRSTIGRTRPPLVVAAAAIAAALLSPTAAAAQTATAQTSDCELVVDAPIPSYGVFAKATLTCQTVQHSITIDSELLQDGVVVASTHEQTHKRSSFGAYVNVNDPAGDQVWCYRATAKVPPYTIGPLTSCASEPF
jgi:hypothetical protein